MDEWVALNGKGRTTDAQPNWPILYANTIAHEFFTFSVFGHFEDGGNTTELTKRAGLMNRLIDFTHAEKWQVVKIFEPTLLVNP